MTEARVRVGFIGIGIMGASMVANLQRAGYPLVIHDKRRAACEPYLGAGATWAGSPRAVAEQSDVVFTCLPGPPEIETVALGPDGLLQGMRPDQACFEMSTNTPDLVKRLNRAFAEQGAHMLDAPISGGAKGAKRGRLAIWVGGEKRIFERFKPVLMAIGDHPTYVGPSGAGIVTKLVHNCASQSMQAALAEVFVLGVKAGADPLALWAAIRQGSIGRRRTFDGLVDEFLPGEYDNPSATLRTVYKDMQISTGLARELGVPMRFANMALADLTEAVNRGWADRDARVVMLLPQQRVGVDVKVARDKLMDVYERDPPAKTDAKHGAPD